MSEELSKVEENTPEEKPKRVKKPKSKVRVILEWTFTGLFALLFVFFAIGQVTGMVNRNKNYGNTLTYGYGTFYIASASMEPEYPVGELEESLPQAASMAEAPATADAFMKLRRLMFSLIFGTFLLPFVCS